MDPRARNYDNSQSLIINLSLGVRPRASNAPELYIGVGEL